MNKISENEELEIENHVDNEDVDLAAIVEKSAELKEKIDNAENIEEVKELYNEFHDYLIGEVYAQEDDNAELEGSAEGEEGLEESKKRKEGEKDKKPKAPQPKKPSDPKVSDKSKLESRAAAMVAKLIG